MTHKDIGLIDNQTIYQDSLESKTESKLTLTNLGAQVLGFTTQNNTGEIFDIILSPNTFDDIKSQPYFMGQTIGPVANRIANAQFKLGSLDYVLKANENNHLLHSGLKGWQNCVWDYGQTSENEICYTLNIKDLEDGFPGNRSIQAKYTLDNNSFSVTYTVTTDKDTPINMTNHSYFNLSGHQSGYALNQAIKINADHVLEVDSDGIPSGKVLAVESTAFDLRHLRPIDTAIEDKILLNRKGYDHSFVLSSADTIKQAAEIEDIHSGLRLVVTTNQPILHFYSGNYIQGEVIGKQNIKYAVRSGYCLETGGYINAVNNPNFPSCLLQKGETYMSYTAYTIETID